MITDLSLDDAFPEVLQERTEACWVNYISTTLEYRLKRASRGVDWPRGSRWLGGLHEAEIAAVEQRWDLRFPPDYRLFLHVHRTVHAT